MNAAPGGPSNAAEVGMIPDLILVNRLQLVIVSVFLYEYIITFGREVSLFWRRKKTGSAWLFFIVRYLALFEYSFLGGISHVRMSDQVCIVLQKVVVAVQLIQFVPWAAFTALRALALSRMNWLLASIVFVLSSAYLAVTAWGVSIAGITGGNAPLVGCIGGPDLSPTQDLIGAFCSLPSTRKLELSTAVVVSRSCGIVADIIVIVVTWRYAMRHRAARAFSAQRGVLSSLGKAILVNGTVYFIVILVINAVQIFPLLSALARRSPIVQFFVIIDPFTAILICSFMLALQAANQQAIRGQVASGTLNDAANGYENLGEMGFASAFVDSMGGTIPSEPYSSLTDSDDHRFYEMRTLPRKRG